MKNYYMEFPSYTIGTDAINEISTVCKKLGKKAVVIGGEKALKSVQSKLNLAIQKGDIEILATLTSSSECSKSNISKLINEIKETTNDQIDFIIGVGGGKVLDTSKAIANELKVDIVTVPTTASTCAATTSLSVVYKEDGNFDEFYFYDFLPKHIFIDTQVLKDVPSEYLRAGMGDTLAKHYECTLASRGKSLSHNSGLAVSMSEMCATPILEFGEKALTDNENKVCSYELEQVILANIITTGMVSLLVEEDYNGALAHSVFYGLTNLEHIEKEYLHGDVVGYGILVQLILDNKMDAFKEVYDFNKKVNIPTSLKDIKVEFNEEILKPVIESILTQPDMEVLPYKVDYEMILNAIQNLENEGEIYYASIS